jgi:DnaJ-class molecular chaperone
MTGDSWGLLGRVWHARPATRVVKCANCDGLGYVERSGHLHTCGSCNGRGMMVSASGQG